MTNGEKNKKTFRPNKLLIILGLICVVLAMLIIGLYLDNEEISIFTKSAYQMKINYASTESNTWDVSEAGDGSVIATLDDNETLTISGTGNMKDYDWYNNRSPWYSKRGQIKNIKIEDGISRIGEDTFYNCYRVCSIEIPDSVTSIGSAAFYFCWSLENVKLPSTLSSIEDFLFSDCYALSSIVIPNSVETIGEFAFQLTGLAKIKIPEGVKSIEYGAFCLCEYLKIVEISSTVTNIEEGVFFNYDSGRLREIRVNDNNSVYSDVDGVLYTKDYKQIIKYPQMKEETEYVILDGVETISFDAFGNSNNLKNIQIPSSVCDLEADAFVGCFNLTEIKVDESNSNYKDDNGVLYTKDGTQIIKYPEGKIGTEYNLLSTTTRIGENAFYGCNKLTNINIPNSVTSIGYGAFNFCENLTNIDIPESVSEIEDGVFYDSKVTQFITNENTTFEIPKILKRAQDENDILYTSKGFELTNCTIKDGIIEIKEGETFAEIKINQGKLDGLTYIISLNSWNVSKDEKQTVTATLSNDGTLTISGTGNMKDYSYESPSPWSDIAYKINAIKIEEGVTSIGENSFKSCNNLKSIQIPNTITTIGDYAFYSCKRLIDLEIPEGVIEIGEYTFMSCYNLTDVEIPSTVTTIGDDAFEYCYKVENIFVDENNLIYMDNNGVLYTKDGSELVKYPQGKINSNYIILKNTTNIKDYAFSSCYYLESIYIPNSITDIEDYAFDDSYNLTLICPKDSIAVTYAQDNDINYLIVIDKIQTKTTVQQMKQEMGSNIECKITNPNGETITGAAYITTGSRVEMANGEKYIIIVTGDANGDGQADIRDILAINKHRLNKASLTIEHLLAGDVNGDGTVDIRDILQINKFRLGKIQTL